MLITDNDRFTVIEQAQTAFAGALVLLVTLALLWLADPVHRIIGTGGTNVVRRITGDDPRRGRGEHGAVRPRGLARPAEALGLP